MHVHSISYSNEVKSVRVSLMMMFEMVILIRNYDSDVRMLHVMHLEVKLNPFHLVLFSHIDQVQIRPHNVL